MHGCVEVFIRRGCKTKQHCSRDHRRGLSSSRYYLGSYRLLEVLISCEMQDNFVEKTIYARPISFPTIPPEFCSCLLNLQAFLAVLIARSHYFCTLPEVLSSSSRLISNIYFAWSSNLFYPLSICSSISLRNSSFRCTACVPNTIS